MRRLLFISSFWWSFASPALSFSGPNLWLPVSYQHHFNELLEASKVAASDPYCYQLIKGTLYESQSSLDKPIFKFYCRSEQRQIFSIIIDPDGMIMTNMLAELPKRREAEKKAQEQERLRLKLLELEKYWNVCHKAFKAKTQLFEGLKVTTTLPPDPHIAENGTVRYIVLFDAESLKGHKISYRATAKIDTLDQCDIKIKPI